MASIRYDRGINQQLRIASGASEQILPKHVVLKSLGVQNIIRLPDKEYPDGAKEGIELIHFGLPIYDTQPNTSAVLASILENGYFQTNKEEKTPLLSFENVWIVKIEKVINQIAYDEIPESYFKNTVGEISDKESLKKVILARYKKPLPGLSDNQILSQGVSVRLLKLIKRASFP